LIFIWQTVILQTLIRHIVIWQPVTWQLVIWQTLAPIVINTTLSRCEEQQNSQFIFWADCHSANCHLADCHSADCHSVYSLWLHFSLNLHEKSIFRHFPLRARMLKILNSLRSRVFPKHLTIILRSFLHLGAH
jgi:hypothetical protein